MIPKIINHIWLQGGIPENYIDNYQKWNNLHPSWEHNIWDEKSLTFMCSKEQLTTYKKLTTLINRVNFLKYILIYNVGGVYADLDSYPIKTIDIFLEQHLIKDIDIECILSTTYPFNTITPNKKFKEYQIIIPARKTTSFYSNKKSILLDNPFLISEEKNLFWIKLIEFCQNRKELKQGFGYLLPHEPYGPYGMTEFLINSYHHPYEENILIIPPIYWANPKTNSNNKYIIHNSDKGW
jgi:hypothetical protein